MRTAVSINVSVPRTDVAFIRKMAKRMGWSMYENVQEKLFDPETGNYLNDETMQAVRDVEAGHVVHCKNLDELIATI